MTRVQSSEFSELSDSSFTDHRGSLAAPSLDSRLSTLDSSFLAHAARIAARGLGRTLPNPSVGCVLVKEGRVLAAAHTGDRGGPHAETQALAIAGAAARGATAYVTLEPCAHHGKTPPCAQALIDAGVARVVVGAIDPDPRVSGKGAAMLKAAGVEVSFPSPYRGEDGRGAATTRTLCISPPPNLPPMGGGNHHSPPTTLYRGFFRRITHGLPYVTAKIATSRDGIMTTQPGHSPWITGPFARAHGHLLRAQSEAILTGIGTVLADNPMLTARAPVAPNPFLIRVIADRQLRIPLTCALVKTAEQQPSWVLTTAAAIAQNASHANALRAQGVVLHVMDDAAFTPRALLQLLAAQGISRVLLEAGPQLSAAFLAAQAVDQLYWYRAPILLGNTGQRAASALHSCLEGIARARPHTTLALGDDCCDIYELHTCLPD